MGEFRLSDRDVEALSAFLLGQPPRAALEPVDWSKADAEKGGEVFRRSRCVTCHAVNGRGGTLGPELTHVGAKASREWLYTLDPRSAPAAAEDADAALPLLGGRGAGRGRVPRVRVLGAAEGLLGERRAPRTRRSPTRAGASSRSAAATRATISRASRSWHASGRSSAPSATACSSRLPLVARGIRPTLPNWIHTKVRTPDAVLDGARMPTFGFGDDEGAALAVALLSLRAREMPLGAHDARPRAARLRAAGRVRGARPALPLPLVPLDPGHGRDALDGRPRPHRQPAHARPHRALRAEAVRHPRRRCRSACRSSNVTPEEARVIADHLSKVMVDDARRARGAERRRHRRARARSSSTRHGCVACHIAGEKGGYVGPELNGSARAAQAGLDGQPG